jgi:protein O-mannosyl-transferase
MLKLNQQTPDARMKTTDSTNTNPRSAESRIGDVYRLAVVLFMTALAYLGTIRFGFVYDDFQQILSNPFIKSWRYVPQYFVSSVWKQLFPFDSGNYYRPIFLLWSRLNYSVFANRPLGWHATAIALHVVVTAMVFFVIRRMTGRSTAAFLTALIFGLHPIHHEVVAWVSGTTESLYAVMFLAAFLAYLRSRDHSKTLWMAISCVFYALTMLSKETAIVLPALVFSHSWIFDAPKDGRGMSGFGRRLSRASIWIAFYVPIAIIYLAVRDHVLSGLGHVTPNATFSIWLMTLPSVLLFYVKNWFLPVRLSEDYDLFHQLKPDFAHVILPALILILIAALLWIFRNYAGSRDMAFGLAWVIIPLLPALDFVVFGDGQLVHDRYFYVPSIGAALLVALVIERAGNAGRVVFGLPLHTVVAALALAVVLATVTTWETSFWRDDFTLFSRAHEIAPRNPDAIINLGVDLIERRQVDQAHALFDAGVLADSGNALFLFNEGRVQYIKGDYAKAEEYTRKAISSNPTAADSYVALGKIQLKREDPADAASSFKRAVELNPYEPNFHTSYGIVLALNGDCTGAMGQFEAALALNPGDSITKMELASCHTPQIPETAAGGITAQSQSNPIRWGFDLSQAASEPTAK